MNLTLSIKDQVELKILLARKGYNQRMFANEIGISKPYLSQLLNDKRNPSPLTAGKIAKGLGMTIDEIFFIQNGNKR